LRFNLKKTTPWLQREIISDDFLWSYELPRTTKEGGGPECQAASEPLEGTGRFPSQAPAASAASG